MDNEKNVMPPFAAPASQQEASERALREFFDQAFLSWNGFHTQAELDREWAHGSLSGEMFRAGAIATSAAKTGHLDVLTLPTAIMNIPCEVSSALGSIAVHAYRRGHRDARHAAADLVLEQADKLAALGCSDTASRCRAQGGDTSQ